VLFIFSSSSLSDLLVKAGLPRIPLVPVSSSQVIVGSVIGIGLYKGAGNINFRILGEIATGWISTPVIAGVLSFFSLFFVKNIFNIDIGTKVVETGLAETVSKPWNVSEVMKYVILAVIAAGIITVVYFYLLERKKKSEFRRSEQRFWKYIK